MEDRDKILPVEETEKAIFDSSIDIGIDMSEICIDKLLDGSFMEDIPILGTIYKIGKIIYSIDRIVYIKKLLVFAQEIQRNDINDDVLQKHKKLIKSNPKKYNEEMEFIIQYLNRQVGYEKSKLNARAYFLYLNEEINKDILMLLWNIIDQFYDSDKEHLEEIYKKTVIGERCSYDRIAYNRLSNCGLISYYHGIAVTDNVNQSPHIAKITEIGRLFCEKILCTNNGQNPIDIRPN